MNIPALTYLTSGLKVRLTDRLLLPMLSFLSRFERPLEIPDSYSKLQTIYPDKGKSCLLSDDAGKGINKCDYPYDVQVVIPVYNTASTLREAIDSVIRQKGNLRVCATVVNDGSPDNSAEILKEYETIENIYITTQQNRGLSGARNAALRQIRGRYITFLDSDDYLPDDALISLYEMARKAGSDIVQGTLVKFGATEKKITVPTLTENGVMLGFACGKLYNSDYFRRFCFPEGYWFEDSLMGLVLFPLASTEKKASVSAPVYYYRNNPEGISNTAHRSPKVIDSVYVTKRLYEDREKMGCPPADDEYGIFLRQTIINLKRVRSFGDRHMLELACCVMRDLKNQYFADSPEPRSRLKYLHKALSQGRYNHTMRLLDTL